MIIAWRNRAQRFNATGWSFSNVTLAAFQEALKPRKEGYCPRTASGVALAVSPASEGANIDVAAILGAGPSGTLRVKNEVLVDVPKPVYAYDWRSGDFVFPAGPGNPIEFEFDTDYIRQVWWGPGMKTRISFVAPRTPLSSRPSAVSFGGQTVVAGEDIKFDDTPVDIQKAWPCYDEFKFELPDFSFDQYEAPGGRGLRELESLGQGTEVLVVVAEPNYSANQYWSRWHAHGILRSITVQPNDAQNRLKASVVLQTCY